MKNIFINILCTISLISLSFVMSNCSEKSYMVDNNYIVLTLIITLIIATIFIYKKIFLNFFLQLKQKRKSITLYLSIILVLYLAYKLYLILSITLSNKVINDYININNTLCIILRIFIISCSLLSLLMGIFFVINNLSPYIKKEVSCITKEEKKLAILFIGVITIVNIIWYTNVPLDNIKDDILYSTDSFYVINNMFPKFNWALDFRHVLFSILFFPLQFIFDILNLFLFNLSSFYYIYLSIINGIFILLIAIMLGRITKNKWVSYLYLCSYPSMLFSVIIEKYQFCVLFLVFFVYIKVREVKNQNLENFSLIGAVGTISTSAVIGVWSSNNYRLNKIKDWIKTVFIFIAICIILGKLGVLMTLFDYISPRNGLGIINRFYGLSEMLSSCFFAPLYIIKNNIFIWQNEANYLNFIGLFILIICIISFLVNRRDLYTRICFFWICFSIFLFIIMNWYCNEAPLFNLYFSWAVISLVCLLIDKIIKKIKLKQFIYIILCVLMIALNSNQLFEIYKFILNF